MLRRDENGEWSNTAAVGGWTQADAIKQGGSGQVWFDKAVDERRAKAAAILRTEGVKVSGDWFGTYAEEKARGTISPTRTTGKRTTARKAASALIAKIPFELSSYIARVYRP